jgi:hypothetical protein
MPSDATTCLPEGVLRRWCRTFDFGNAGLPYFNPHSFRNTLVRFGQELCRSPEEYKAWSQNLRHEKVLTTFMSYGAVARMRQGEIFRGLTTSTQLSASPADEIAEAVFRKLQNSGTFGS